MTTQAFVRTWAVLLACLTFFIGSPAFAQRGGERGDRGPRERGGGFARMFEPGITSKEFESFAKLAKLTPDQRTAATALYEAYTTSYNEFAKTQREAMDALRDLARTGDQAAGEKMGEEFQTIRTKRTAMDDGFMKDFKAVLSPAQVEDRWVMVEQQRHRDQARNAFGPAMSGERLDLIKITEDLTPAPSAAVKVQLDPILHRYAADMDRELVERLKIQEDGMTNFRTYMRTFNFDAAQKLFDKGRASANRVREVNQRYAREIEAALPEDLRPKFSQTVEKESFPQVYRALPADRVIEAVSKMDLSGDNKATFATIQADFQRNLASANKQYETAILAREESINPVDLIRQAMEARQAGQRPQGMRSAWETPDITAARKKRDQLSKTTVDKIKAILTPEQVAKLPKDQPEDDNAGGPPPAGRENGRGRRNRGNRPATTTS